MTRAKDARGQYGVGDRLRAPTRDLRRHLAWGLAALAATLGCGADEAGPQPAPSPGEPSAQTAPRPVAPDLQFTDVTAASGVEFVHENGAFGGKWMPETMGSGCALLDVDDDDDLDLFLVNGCPWPGHEPARGSAGCRLYANDGEGHFADATAGVGEPLYGMGVAAADYDGDGDADLYLTAVGPNRLLRNDGGRFRDATAAAGVGGGQEWSTSAAWLDADGDGWPDLIVANYVRWTPEGDLFTTIDGVHKSYATPQQYDGLPCRLYLNDGDGTLRDASGPSGIGGRAGKSLGIAIVDLEDDGRPDVVVANDTEPTFLFANRGGGRFEEIGARAGLAYDDAGRARAGMGIDASSPDNDRTLAVAIGNFSHESLSFYRQRQAEVFVDEAGRRDLAGPTHRTLTFGLLFADLDLDGFEDLVLANGHIEPTVNRVQADVTYAQPAQLFWNDGAGRFAAVGAGGPFAQALVGRGLAAGDVDGDGDLDLALTQNAGPARLLRNDTAGGRAVRVRLRGAPPNTAALGALVTVTAGGVEQRRWVRTGSSYLSQSETTLTFGLGARPAAQRVAVRWPDGRRDAFADLSAGATYVIEQGGAAPRRVPFARPREPAGSEVR